MPQVIYTEHGDEIVELIDRVRKAPDNEVALVLSAGAVGFQSPLNVRLLRDLGTRAGKSVSIISGDPYIQELSRMGGLATYASVPAFERGIQTVRAHADVGNGSSMAGTATALATAPALAPPLPPRTAATAAGAAKPAAAGKGLGGPRRPWYFAAAGLVILGLILFVFVAPSAKVTITLAGTPLTINPTIQGSPDAANAKQADHIVTTVVTSDQSASFAAKPTGTQPVAATAAAATIVFSTSIAEGAQFDVPKGEEFDTQDNPPIKFFATQSTHICVGPNGSPPVICPTPNNSVPVADGTGEAKGNVAANTITKWPGNPCPAPPSVGFPGCSASDLTETNPAAATGGADAKTNVVASSQDVAGWTTQVTQSEQTLTGQAKQDMQSKAGGKTFAVDPGGNGTTVACAVTPALPAANAVFGTTQETVACHGKAALYNPSDISTDVKADLQTQVAQGDSLAVDQINCTKTAVTQAADDGTVVLSVQCTSFSRQNVDLNALKGQLAGKSPSDARNIIQHRLNHVQNVSVSQSPVPFFWLPFFSGRIEIDEVFVAQPTAGT
ncbi:MAG TPA: hypothetical protein VIG86_00865 [Candidatus Dormibacteraeota bacterium]|jgi:hypothetical protein